MANDNAGIGRSPVFLRFALGLVYFHFGVLKFFPDLSPAEMLATQTVMSVTLHWLNATTALWCLALLECAIGAGLLFNALPSRPPCLALIISGWRDRYHEVAPADHWPSPTI